MASVTFTTPFGRLPRWVANLLLVGLVIYFAWVMGRLTWMIAWQDPVMAGPTASATAASLDSAVEQTPLAAYDLFGRPPVGAPVAEAVKQTAPETNLRMHLEGVMVAARSEESGAIVSGTDGSTAYYRVGDVMPGDIELVEVDPLRILIRRNGEVESLAFEDGDAEGMVSEVQDETRGMSPEAFVEDAQAQLAAEGDAALQRYGLKPVASGSQQGYVYDGSNPMLSALNLKEGDVITAINGQPLGDIEQDRQLLEDWRNQPQIQVEVMRDGASFTVNYALPQ
ncbi:general secretion pathway protein GspC [Marinobacter sp. R17]|uniref:type II secretion system protein N n=1 Tax=Marinobacter sp. R17 TaxID=2484250 RepID=UPI000F4C7014|nr:type II secretion system protein N [Marinobacter sp. R17]ROU01717.1 general secretion pathway protein GspC [Marinobacter sp. R17]